jgi:hypothetical protein
LRSGSGSGSNAAGRRLHSEYGKGDDNYDDYGDDDAFDGGFRVGDTSSSSSSAQRRMLSSVDGDGDDVAAEGAEAGEKTTPKQEKEAKEEWLTFPQELHGCVETLSHRQFVCPLALGAGTDVRLFAKMANETPLAPLSNFTFSYAAPALHSVVYSNSTQLVDAAATATKAKEKQIPDDTYGYLTLSGVNFGPGCNLDVAKCAFRTRVTVGDGDDERECVPSPERTTHTRIVCEVGSITFAFVNHHFLAFAFKHSHFFFCSLPDLPRCRNRAVAATRKPSASPSRASRRRENAYIRTRGPRSRVLWRRKETRRKAAGHVPSKCRRTGTKSRSRAVSLGLRQR